MLHCRVLDLIKNVLNEVQVRRKIELKYFNVKKKLFNIIEIQRKVVKPFSYNTKYLCLQIFA
jgi:hypothetical protein